MLDLKTVEISNAGVRASLLSYGASLRDLRFEDAANGFVIGYDDPEDYIGDGQFLGAVIGRYANRIGGGKAVVAGQCIQLEQNDIGSGHLHGGSQGFGVQNWDIADQDAHSVTFALHSADGDAGYPGNLDILAKYEITADAVMRLTLSCTSDKETIVNLCHHPYFNLDGQSHLRGHSLQVQADRVLISGDDLIPTGLQLPVAGSEFDYTEPQKLRTTDINNTYCLHDQQTGELAYAARLETAEQALEVWTTQPGLHVYNG